MEYLFTYKIITIEYFLNNYTLCIVNYSILEKIQFKFLQI